MKLFPPGSSVNAVLDHIVQNGLSFYPSQAFLCDTAKIAEPGWIVNITGVALDSLLNPIVGATVWFTDSSGMSVSTVTSSSGSWKVSAAISNGVAIARLTAPGYSTPPFSRSGNILATFNNSAIIFADFSPVPVKV